MRIRARAACWVFAMTIAACSSPPHGDQASGAKPTGQTAKSAEVTLTTVKWPELQSAIASHKGKVVVLDVWGTF
jgi:hypothetical protein